MRLGILSDTHDELERTRATLRLLRNAGAEAVVHCGDLCGPAVVEICAALPFWFVFGNYDADGVPALRDAAAASGATCLGWGGVIELGGRRVGVTHGHMTSDIRRVTAARPDFLLSGHSHAAHEFITDSVRRINPGALHRAEIDTAAVLDLSTDAVQFLRVPD